MEKEMGMNTIVEGPLAIREIEKREIKPQATQAPFGKQNDDWLRFKDKYQKGDEIYYFNSMKMSEDEFGIGGGFEGYVLIRKDKIIDTITTRSYQ